MAVPVSVVATFSWPMVKPMPETEYQPFRQLLAALMVRSACCLGYSSEVASRLYDGQTATIVALFDLRSLGVSLRRSPDCVVDLSVLAQNFGGGGHPAAAGFAINELKRAPAERLAEILGERLKKTEQ